MRILVIGTHGQVARALADRAANFGVVVTPVGRPQLDLLAPARVWDAIHRAGGDVVVNAAAFTVVDQAESEPELSEAVNGAGAGIVAEAAAAMGVPVVHLSTDYVFDGNLDRPYRETDPVNPLGVYGRSKLAGERAVASATPNHVVLRTSWVYSPYGRNFVKTMLRLAADRDEVTIVADQHGSPTSAHDIAEGVIAVCRNLVERPSEASLRGLFHMAGEGFTTWAEFAAFIFERSKALGGPSARVRLITTAEYPTPAKRPANSRLDCRKLAAAHGVKLPHWRSSAARCIEHVLKDFVGEVSR